MRVLILGGTTGTGRKAVERGLARGHTVTALARTPAKLEVQHPSLRVIKGDVFDPASLTPAIAGQDAVIFAVGATSAALEKTPTVFSDGTKHTADVMRANGVKRLVVLSSHGSGDSRAHASFFLVHVLMPLLLAPYFDDHGRQEEVVRSSGLEWVIVRPSMLGNGAAKGRYKIVEQPGGVPARISRTDVADFMLAAAETDEYVGKAISIGG